jgi:ABC-type polysaccharide/polyol phosphate export permease
MGGYLGAIWRCRFFWLSLVQMDLRTRYRGSWLGIGWSLLQPLAMSIILCVVFSRLMHRGRGDNISYYGPYLVVGLVLWNFLLNTALGGCHCFRAAEAYIRQYPAPLAIYPLRTVLGFAFHFLLGLLVALVLAAGMNGLHNGLALLSLVPGLCLILLLGWALALLAGLANVHISDTGPFAEVAFSGLFYLTPIMYSKEWIAQSPELTLVVRYNPLSYFLRLLRDPILDGHPPSWRVFCGATASVLLLVGLSAYLLRRLEGRVIYYL